MSILFPDCWYQVFGERALEIVGGVEPPILPRAAIVDVCRPGIDDRLPLGIGLLVGRRWPASKRLISGFQNVSTLVLLVCGGFIIAKGSSLMGSIVREGALTAVILITLLWLAAGHFLGGPNDEDRTVLAHGTVSRHPGVAIVVATLTDERLDRKSTRLNSSH